MVEAADADPAAWGLWGRACFEAGLARAAAGKPKEESRPWFAEAERGFRVVFDLDEYDPDVRWRIGQAREWQGDDGVAQQFYELQISEFPRLPAGYARLGRLLATRARRPGPQPGEAGRLREEALDAFRRGREVAAPDGDLLFLLAEVPEEFGLKEEALESYAAAARADPDDRRAWDRLAERSNPEKVLYRLAREVLQAHPTAAAPAMWAGYFANRRDPQPGESPWDRHEEALAWILPALAVHGEHEGLYQEAFDAAQALSGTDPKNAPDPETGIEAFEKIHEAWPWSGDAANNLGFLYREAAKYDRSLEWYLKAVERAPENQDILNDTGLIYLFHLPREKAKGLPFFLKTLALVLEGDQRPERGYWDALENLCKHYTEVDPKPEKVIEYARMRYEKTKGVAPYNMSPVARRWAEKAKKALGR